MVSPTPLPCSSSRVLQNATIHQRHQGHPPSSAMTRRELKTDRGIHVRRGVLLFQLLLVPPPCPPSFLRSWRAHSPRAAAAASGGVVLLGAGSRGAGMASVGCWGDRSAPQTCTRQLPRPSSLCRCALLRCFECVVLIGVLQELM